MGQNSSSSKNEREFLSQYNSIYQVMYDQKHIRDFLLYLRQKLSDKGHFENIMNAEALFNGFSDDIETICLKLSLSDMDQYTAISIYDYLQYLLYSQQKLNILKDNYDNYIYLLKDKINCDKSKHLKEYKQLFDRFVSKFNELKVMMDQVKQLDSKTVKACLKSCSQKYIIPQGYSLKQNQLFNDSCPMYTNQDHNLCSIQNDLFEAY